MQRSDLKTLVQKLGLPLTKSSALIVDVLYRHYLTSATPGPPLLPKGNPLYAALGQFAVTLLAKKAGVSKKAKPVKMKYGPAMLSIVWKQFKTLMNDPSTYDESLPAARNRVQPRPGRPDAENFLPIPQAKRTAQPDRRYTAGTYGSARDLLDRRKYTSIAGGPFGGYQVDLLDMGVKGKPYNKQFWYLLTLINTNSRYAYACPVKKGADVKKGATPAQRRALAELADREEGKKDEPHWINNHIIPAFENIMAQIKADLDKDTKGELKHREIKSVMMDSGAEFQVTLRAWLQDQKKISSIVCAPETHEEMARLNSFHRYFRQRYTAQWRKYFENPRGYGGPVRWINPKSDSKGFALAPSAEALVHDVVDGDDGEEDEELPEPLFEGQGGRGPDDDDAAVEDMEAADENKDEDADTDDKDDKDDDDDDWDKEYTPKEQKIADATGVWRITYWQDWIDAHNTTVKAQSLRGAEVALTKKRPRHRRTVRLRKAPADITDAMVHNLIRYDADRREAVKRRVDQWVLDHNVLTQEDLPDDQKHQATRVRLDLNRSKYGAEIKQKGTRVLSIWSERHYALEKRVGTNSYRVSHGHGTDFPYVWPIYRLRIVEHPENVVQPATAEVKVRPAEAKATVGLDKLTAQTRRDEQVVKAREAAEEKLREEKEQEDEKRAKALAEQEKKGGYDPEARIEDIDKVSEPSSSSSSAKKKSHKRKGPKPSPSKPSRASGRARKDIDRFVP